MRAEGATLACAAMKRPSFESILAARLSRRAVLSGATAAGLAACAGIPTNQGAAVQSSPFRGIGPQSNDAFVIAEGYRYNVVARWGDSLVTGTPDFDTRRMADTSWITPEAVDAQSRQFGSNCDAVQYFPLVRGRAARGLVCVNHEYFNAELVFAGHGGIGMKAEDRARWMSQHPHAVKFMQQAHGVSVMQLGREHGWKHDPSSRFTRRVTALTPMEI